MGFTGSRAVCAVTSLLMLLTGCTDIYKGVGVRDPHTDPNMVNAKLLDVGSYPTTPLTPLGSAKTPEDGALVEGRRMADVVLAPFEVDPELANQKKDARPFNSAEDLTSDLYGYPEIGTGAERHNLVAGFMSAAGSNRAYTDSLHIVIRFATPEDATAAAREMADHGKKEARLATSSRHPDAIEGRPDILAATQETENKFRQLITYVAHDSYVIVDVTGDQKRDDAAHRAVDAVDKQIKLLDGFTPTPVDKLADLPIDPTGLQARTIPAPRGSSRPYVYGVYGEHGALHFMQDPPRDRPLFSDTGLSALSLGLATVFQVRDYNGATQLTEGLSGQLQEDTYNGYSLDAPISGMSAGRCYKPQNKGSLTAPYRCMVPVDRYVITTNATDPVKARQAIAAQYLMLTAK